MTDHMDYKVIILPHGAELLLTTEPHREKSVYHNVTKKNKQSGWRGVTGRKKKKVLCSDNTQNTVVFLWRIMTNILQLYILFF